MGYMCEGEWKRESENKEMEICSFCKGVNVDDLRKGSLHFSVVVSLGITRVSVPKGMTG